MPQIVNIAIDRLFPHSDNPRKDLGDLSELAASIKASGILQNLTVVPNEPENSNTDFTIMIGHRRFAAAKIAGLTEMPCIVVEMSEREQLQTMLVENMQRSDLTVYEQAQGFQMMLNMGDSVAEIAEKSGFSQTTIRRRVHVADKEGRVVILPCKVGDAVWFVRSAYRQVDNPIEATVTGFASYGTTGEFIFTTMTVEGQITRRFLEHQIGKTVFLSFEEAERALEERKNV